MSRATSIPATSYMLRAPMALAKMRKDADGGTVIYRSKMHPGLKWNFR